MAATTTPRPRVATLTFEEFLHAWPRMAGAEEPDKDKAGDPPEKDKQDPPADDPDAQLLAGARDPDAVRNALKAERETARAAKARADELAAEVAKYKDRDKSDQEKLEERAGTAETRATAAEVKLLRFEVAAEKNIPLKHAHRLQGSTKEELAKDADELAKELGDGGTGTSFDGGPRRPAPSGSDMDAQIRHAAGRA